MTIEHVALWAHDIEKSREFYCTYFGGTAGEKYINESKEFESYFISFETGARLEIMHMRGKTGPGDTAERYTGYSHFAISVESKSLVNSLALQIEKDGYQVVSSPRTTGDGYYEACVLDPDGNRVEICA